VIFGEKFISSIEKSERVSIPVLRLLGRQCRFSTQEGRERFEQRNAQIEMHTQAAPAEQVVLAQQGRVETQEYARVAKKGKPVF
jgi:hypothetical protein